MMSKGSTFSDRGACTIEVLIVPGCPGAKLALTRVQEAAEQLGVDATLRVLTVDDVARARDLAFVGSPTVRVGGRDVEDVEGRPFGLSCRLYAGDGVVERAPPSEWIRRAIASVRRPS